ncbi:unnamed protein product, partial [Musa banksii]
GCTRLLPPYHCNQPTPFLCYWRVSRKLLAATLTKLLTGLLRLSSLHQAVITHFAPANPK